MLLDTDTVHPPRICNLCFATLRRLTKAAEDGVPHKHSVVVFEWSRHTENCLVSLLQEPMLCMNKVKHTQVCQHFDSLTKGSGRSQKGKWSCGRPSGETLLSVLEHISQIVPESFLTDEAKVPLYDSESPHLCFPICCTVLDQPLELACGSIICAGCCRQWIQHTQMSNVSCPSCYDHQLSSASIRPLPPLILSLLSDLVLPCNRCGKLVKTNEYTRHLSSNSRPVLNSPSEVTLKDVLTRPVSTPATQMERKHLVR